MVVEKKKFHRGVVFSNMWCFAESQQYSFSVSLSLLVCNPPFNIVIFQIAITVSPYCLVLFGNFANVHSEIADCPIWRDLKLAANSQCRPTMMIVSIISLIHVWWDESSPSIVGTTVDDNVYNALLLTRRGKVNLMVVTMNLMLISQLLLTLMLMQRSR